MLMDDSGPLRSGYSPLTLDEPEAIPLTARLPPTPNDDDSRQGTDVEASLTDEVSLQPGSDIVFGAGERVSYYSASHNQWLSARVLRPNFNGEGSLVSYDLDVRKRAEATKIRRALPDFHGDEEALKRRIESFRPSLAQRFDFMLDSLSLRWKRATSQGDLLWLKRSIKFVAFAMQPFVDAVTGIILLANQCYWGAGVCLWCMLTPHLVLCMAYRGSCSRRYRVQLRAEAFRKALGRSPGLCSIMLTDICMVFHELNDTATTEAQNYVTLRHTVSLTESCPWGLVQLVIAALQVAGAIEVISPYWLMVSIPQSLFNAYTAYSSMLLLGSLAHEGDLAAHLESLIRLSLGAAPPQVLERILEEREVFIDEDLRQLNRRGFRSLARAMGRSRVAESVTFRDTGLDRFVSENTDDTERANLWAHFCCDFCDNRSALESVSFSPEVAIPRQVWQEVRRFNMPVLGQVWNGGELAFERDRSDDPLQLATRADDWRGLREALATSGSDLGQARIATMLACCFDHWRSLQVLLARTPAHAREPMMLSHAAENGAKACVSMLLDAQSNPDAKGRSGLTALEMASLKGYSSIVRDLLSAKANPDLCGSFVPLASVAFSNDGEVARALLEANANVHYPHRNDVLPLHIAAREGAGSVVTALVKARADLDPQEAKDLMTPLHFAAQRGHSQVVRLLAGHRADVNALSRKRNSPLHNAAWEGMAEVVQALLHGRADAASRNGSGCTALDFALQRHWNDIVQLLSGKDPVAA